MSRLSSPLPVTLLSDLSCAEAVMVMPVMSASPLATGASRVKLPDRLSTPGFSVIVMVVVVPLSTKLTDATLAASMPKRSEEHTSELQSLMRISYAVFCLKKKKAQKYETASEKY